MTHYYYYDPDSKLFVMRCSKPYAFTNLPYIEMPAGWRYDQHRMTNNGPEPL